MRLLNPLSAFALGLPILVAAPVMAGELPAAKAEYSAVQSLTANGAKVEAKVFHARGKERREAELEGVPTVLLLRPDRKKAFIHQPGLNMAMEIAPLDPEVGIDVSMLGGLDAEALGKEKVGGLDTTKYRVQDVFEQGGGFDGFVWSTDDGIYARVQGRATDGGEGVELALELRDVKRGGQNPGLFDLPKGVQLMNMDTLEGRTPPAFQQDAKPAERR